MHGIFEMVFAMAFGLLIYSQLSWRGSDIYSVITALHLSVSSLRQHFIKHLQSVQASAELLISS
jgi:hypothetical protein